MKQIPCYNFLCRSQPHPQGYLRRWQLGSQSQMVLGKINIFEEFRCLKKIFTENNVTFKNNDTVLYLLFSARIFLNFLIKHLIPQCVLCMPNPKWHQRRIPTKAPLKVPSADNCVQFCRKPRIPWHEGQSKHAPKPRYYPIFHGYRGACAELSTY